MEDIFQVQTKVYLVKHKFYQTLHTPTAELGLQGASDGCPVTAGWLCAD